MNPVKVLILEDHPVQRAAVETAVKACGDYDVLSLAEGAQALKSAKYIGGVDIAICDINMPGEDGLSFLRKAANAGVVKSVIITSSIPDSMRQGIITMIRLLGLEFLGDLAKPVGRSELKIALSSYGNDSRLNELPSLPVLVELPSRDELFDALLAGQFVPFLQPKIKVLTGEVVGAEALARWSHPVRGILGAGEFMSAVEREGMSDLLFWSVFEKVCRFKAENRERMIATGEISINVSAGQLASHSFSYEVRDMLRLYKLPASAIKLELTEMGFLTAPATTLENLVRLRLMGVGIAMDDFGAGYSSLGRLSELPFSEIKLDASFIKDVGVKPLSASIVQGFMDLGGRLNVDVVIEGVENSEQLKVVSQMENCIVQGFYYSAPLPLDEFLTYRSLVA